MKQRFTEITKNKWFAVAGWVLLGALVVLAIRFATYTPPETTHYHANYAVYINGAREEFKAPQYYQDVTACSAEESNNPKTRTHMHSNINDVIHVHDKAATWGHFFENIGWTLGKASIITGNGTVYTENDQNKLHLILNGQDYTSLGGIANMTINSEDKLLISYGESTIDVMDQYKKINGSATQANQHPDPKTCKGSGNHHTTLGDRFKSLF